MENSKQSAFPVPSGTAEQNGLTKREIFAMAAMQGILAGRSVTYFDIEKDRVALYAMQFADELLKQLESK